MRLYHRVIWLSELTEEPSISVSSGLPPKTGYILWRSLIQSSSQELEARLPGVMGEERAGCLNLQRGNFHLSLFSVGTPTLNLAWYPPETWRIHAQCPVWMKVGGAQSPGCMEFRDAGWIWTSDRIYLFTCLLPKPRSLRDHRSPARDWTRAVALKAKS